MNNGKFWKQKLLTATFNSFFIDVHKQSMYQTFGSQSMM